MEEWEWVSPMVSHTEGSSVVKGEKVLVGIIHPHPMVFRSDMW